MPPDDTGSTTFNRTGEANGSSEAIISFRSGSDTRFSQRNPARESAGKYIVAGLVAVGIAGVVAVYGQFSGTRVFGESDLILSLIGLALLVFGVERAERA